MHTCTSLFCEIRGDHSIWKYCPKVYLCVRSRNEKLVRLRKPRIEGRQRHLFLEKNHFCHFCIDSILVSIPDDEKELEFRNLQ